jgi:peptide/nickel transport system substrate-binding protein
VGRRWRSRGFMEASLLVVSSLIAAACTGGAAPTTTLAPTTAAVTTTEPAGSSTTVAMDRPYGGTVVVADDQEPATLNKFAPGGDSGVMLRIGQALYAGVWDVDGYSLSQVPELVTELPTVANGGVTLNEDGTMTVRYQIRDEAVWSDGVPITGEDFQYTLDVIMDPALPIDRTTYDTITSTVVGEKTFEYTMSSPTVKYDLLFSDIIPKHQVEGTDFERDWNDTMWVSAGPFVLDEWKKGEYIRLVRNENYWKTDPETGQQLPYLDEVIFRFIPETSDLVTAFENREVQVVQPPPGLAVIERLRALEPEGAVVEVLNGTVWEQLAFEFGPGRLERNPESANESLDYRKAVAFAIDRERIIDEILNGQVEPLQSILKPSAPGIAGDAWAQYSYDPDTARAFLEAAKEDLGVDTIKTVFTTTSNFDTRVRLSELLAEMLGDVGIEYENSLENSQMFFSETRDAGLWDMASWAIQGPPGLSGALALFDVFDPDKAPPEGQNVFQWGSPDSSVVDENTEHYAELYDQMEQTFDPDQLAALMQQAEQILADQVVIIPLYARLVAAAAWGDEVAGFKHNPTSASDTWNIEQWYRADLVEP